MVIANISCILDRSRIQNTNLCVCLWGMSLCMPGRDPWTILIEVVRLSSPWVASYSGLESEEKISYVSEWTTCFLTVAAMCSFDSRSCYHSFLTMTGYFLELSDKTNHPSPKPFIVQYFLSPIRKALIWILNESHGSICMF